MQPHCTACMLWAHKCPFYRALLLYSLVCGLGMECSRSTDPIPGIPSTHQKTLLPTNVPYLSLLTYCTLLITHPPLYCQPPTAGDSPTVNHGLSTCSPVSKVPRHPLLSNRPRFLPSMAQIMPGSQQQVLVALQEIRTPSAGQVAYFVQGLLPDDPRFGNETTTDYWYQEYQGEQPCCWKQVLTGTG